MDKDRRKKPGSMDPSDDEQKKRSKPRRGGMEGFRGMFDRSRSNSSDKKPRSSEASQPATAARSGKGGREGGREADKGAFQCQGLLL